MLVVRPVRATPWSATLITSASSSRASSDSSTSSASPTHSRPRLQSSATSPAPVARMAGASTGRRCRDRQDLVHGHRCDRFGDRRPEHVALACGLGERLSRGAFEQRDEDRIGRNRHAGNVVQSRRGRCPSRQPGLASGDVAGGLVLRRELEQRRVDREADAPRRAGSAGGTGQPASARPTTGAAARALAAALLARARDRAQGRLRRALACTGGGRCRARGRRAPTRRPARGTSPRSGR